MAIRYNPTTSAFLTAAKVFIRDGVPSFKQALRVYVCILDPFVAIDPPKIFQRVYDRSISAPPDIAPTNPVLTGGFPTLQTAHCTVDSFDTLYPAWRVRWELWDITEVTFIDSALGTNGEPFYDFTVSTAYNGQEVKFRARFENDIGVGGWSSWSNTWEVGSPP